MKYVLFDIDSTLIEAHQPSNKEASKVVFKKIFGINAHEELIDFRGMAEEGIIKKVVEKVAGIKLKKVPKEAYDLWAKTSQIALLKRPPKVMPGIEKMLAALSRRNAIYLAVLTGNSEKRAHVKLASTRLIKYFINKSGKLKGIFGTQADNREKLLIIAKRKYLKSRGDKIILIDDSLMGAKMAKKHKVPAIMVATSDFSQKELGAYVQYTFPDFGKSRWKQAIKIIDTI